MKANVAAVWGETMGHLAIFSALYLIVASLSPVMGAYVLRLHKEETTNRIFFLACLCLMLWALGFSVIVAAPDEKTAALWMRISAVGIEIVYSVMVHFTLLLTGHEKLLKKKWIYPLMYLPAVFCLYAFAISPSLTSQMFRFSYTEGGWLRNTPSTVFDTIFKVYYIAAFVTTILLIWFWQRKSKKEDVKKQARLLISSFVGAIVLGTFTDIINNYMIHLPIPQIAPVFFVLPIGAIFYCFRKYHMMRSTIPGDEELILSDERRVNVFRIASAGLIAGGVVLFVIQYFWWTASNPVLTIAASLLLMALGVISAYVQRTRKGVFNLEILLILTSMIVTPILTINMVPMGGSAIWAFPVIMIVCALVFSSRDMLFSTSITVLFSQIYLLAVMPSVEVTINYRTYVSRIVILLFIMTIAFFVHRIYTERLKENAAQSRTQSLVSGIASKFFLSGNEDAPEHMTALLEELLEFFKADTAFICPVENDCADIISTHQCTLNGTEMTPQHIMLCMERWDKYLNETEAQFISEQNEKKHARRGKKLKSTPWVFVPIYEDGRPVAFIYIETSRTYNVWTKEQIIAVPVVSRIVSDSLEKLRSENRIKYMAYYDSLTALPNRQLFHDRAEQAIHLARRTGSVLGFMFLDLDFFKSINDTIGHSNGDKLLRILGQKLADCLRKSDTVARFGGDEFLVMLNSIQDVEDIVKVADKIMAMFQESIYLKGQEVFVTASAGISVFPVDGDDVQTLIKHADVAMYTAKEKGKNRYEFCSGNMKERLKYRVNLSNHLCRVLDRGELQVYYQPQIHLNSDKIVGFEALLRWQHPEYGLLSPAEFIPLAEQTGLINPIGAWVLETACLQAANWTRSGYGDLRVAVNISVVQLRNSKFVRTVAEILRKTCVNPAQIELEISESTMMHEPDYIIRVLNDLKALGVSISIDDFGIEYSSLNRLKLLPVDRLKMDIQFVRGINKGEKDQAITTLIMNLAKNMDVKLIAEGVENSSQLDFLKDGMCDEAQGYFYYKPMPAADAEEILKK